MKSVIVLASLFAIASAARAADLPMPLAEASSGKMQCYAPNPAKKTCASLAGYRIDANGTIVNTATVLIAPNPVITMETTSPVTIKNSQVCGPLRKEDLDTATFTQDGKPMDANQANQIRQQMAEESKAMLGHEICTVYVAQGNSTIAKSTDNGTPMKDDAPMIWVSPSEGYRVAP